MFDALLSGIFGVVVAVITWVLSSYRENKRLGWESRRESMARLESVYADCIEELEIGIRQTVSLSDYSETEAKMSRNNALIKLLSTSEINNQLEEVSIVMNRWSTLYREASPKPVGDTGISFSTSSDLKKSTEAKNYWPTVNKEIVKLIELMKEHLSTLKKAA